MRKLQSRWKLCCLVGLTALLCGCQKNAGEEFAAARKSVESGDRSTAIIQLSNTLQLDPNLAEARLLFGETLLELGNASSAKIELKKAQKLGIDDNRVVPTLIRAELASGDPRKVLPQYANLKLSNNAAQAEAMAALAEGYKSIGNEDEAQKLVASALRLDPENARAQLADIRRSNDAGEYDSAKSRVIALTEKHPKFLEGWLLRGDLLAKQPATRPQAFEAYEKANAIQRRDPRPLAAMVTLHLLQGELDAAAKDTDRLRSVSRDSFLTHYMSTWVKLEKGDFKGASESAQSMLRLAPNDPNAEHLAGVVALRAGRFVQAERMLARALTEHREHAELRIQLASAQMRMGSARKALATLKPLLAAPKPPSAALALAAEASVLAGDALSARTYHTETLILDPKNVKSKIYLALEKMGRGNTAQGLEDLRSAAASDPAITADLTLVAALLDLRRYDEALAAVDAIDKKKPGTPIASHLRGQLAFALGQTDKAKQEWQEALRRDSAYFSAARGLAGLYLRQNDVAKADQTLTDFLAKNPLNGNAVMDLYAVKTQAGTEVSKLQSFLQASITAAPEILEPRLALIRSHLDNRQIRPALEQAQAALTLFPDDRQILRLLALVQINNVDSTQARATINKLRDLPGEDAEHLVAVAQLQMANGDPNAAVQTLNKSISVNGDTPEVLKALMTALYKSNKAADALKLISRKRAQDPVTGMIMEADWHAMNSRHADAAKLYADAVAKRPSSELALQAMASMSRAGMKAEVTRFENNWMQQYPRDVVVMITVAEKTLFSGDAAAAEKLYRRVLAVQPENGVALNNLASILTEKDPAAARDLAERANMASPNRPWFIDTWAAALAKSGDLKAAIEKQRAAVALAPDIHEHRLHLAQFLLQSGDKSSAKRELETLQRLGAAFSQHALVEKLLAESV